MNMYDLIGIGIGPSNLSLAALSAKKPDCKQLFLEKKSQFDWHPEIMFADSTMQTSYLKDLVTPVDPTNPCSFLNFLGERGLFYLFLNTQRTNITRLEYQQYGQWVAQKLADRLRFDTEVRQVIFKDNHFEVQTSSDTYHAKNICVGTGHKPWVPECTTPFLSANFFHGKSGHLQNLNLEGKEVVVLGGGQTGIELFRNALQKKWGTPKKLHLISRRANLEPLDESAFSNEYFTPSYVDQFWNLPIATKDRLVESQKLTSDGNTPYYLKELYNDLYRLRHIENAPMEFSILPLRQLRDVKKADSKYQLCLHNEFTQAAENLKADVVILATGFATGFPPVLEPLIARLKFDAQERVVFNKNYSLQWAGPAENKIYALNHSRHNHGIVDPQTSLMAYRSAVVFNDLVGSDYYPMHNNKNTFLNYNTIDSEPQL